MESTTGVDFVQVRNCFLRHLNGTSSGIASFRCPMGTGGLFVVVKWPKPESDGSYLGSAEVRNMRNI
jgi:hypothetical protein